ncbi:MAG: hypothetical protein EB015_21465, partial [Methylocystaceae bacterium]|nr:hypothetical protein [Methylocystaceae bacterium]
TKTKRQRASQRNNRKCNAHDLKQTRLRDETRTQTRHIVCHMHRKKENVLIDLKTVIATILLSTGTMLGITAFLASRIAG